MNNNNFINISKSKSNTIIKDFEIKGYAKLGKIITEKFRKKLLGIVVLGLFLILFSTKSNHPQELSML